MECRLGKFATATEFLVNNYLNEILGMNENVYWFQCDHIVFFHNTYHKMRLVISWTGRYRFILQYSRVHFEFRIRCHWMKICFTIPITCTSGQCNREYTVEPLIFEAIEIVFGQFQFIIQIEMTKRPHTILLEAVFIVEKSFIIERRSQQSFWGKKTSTTLTCRRIIFHVKNPKCKHEPHYICPCWRQLSN